MKLLFFSYWGLEEGLTASTVLPNLDILANFPQVEQIFYCSIERGKEPVKEVHIHPKVVHIPIYSKNYPVGLINKFADSRITEKILIDLIRQHAIDLLICRSSPAGGIGYQVHRKTKIPFFVESFEPHAEYMLEAGSWSKRNPKYWIQKIWENQVIKYAQGIMPVNNNYKDFLIEKKGVSPARIQVMPCCTPLEKFRLDLNDRVSIRQNLGISDQVNVGIYVGKFGDNYYREEAFNLFKMAKDFWGQQFFLIILSPKPHVQILEGLQQVGLKASSFVVNQVPHDQVPAYLSASDFAFSTVKTTPSRIYCSAIKHGEYWANGLPILITEGIGEDSEIVKREDIGGVFQMEDKVSIKKAIEKVDFLLRESTRLKRNEKIKLVANTYRNFEIIENAYGKFLAPFGKREKIN